MTNVGQLLGCLFFFVVRPVQNLEFGMVAVRTGRGPLRLAYLQIAFRAERVPTAACAVKHHVAEEADWTFLGAVVLVFQAGEARGDFPVKDELSDCLVLPGAGRVEASGFCVPV